ncbi:MAG TPA: hypothetical protein VFV01_29700 [Spirillospora sp.]|nr:hypothetical protein [Spirillospora sp.]
MTGIELVVACLTAWALRKAHRLAGRADAEVDSALDAAMDRLHEKVSRRLGEDPALRQLESEAGNGADSPRTRQRVALALEEAIDQDAEFGRVITALAEEISQRQMAKPSSPGHSAIGNNNSTVIQAGRDISGDILR